MASLSISPVHCNANAEKPFSRVLRIAGTCLLTAQSLVLVGAALSGALDSEPQSRLGDVFFLTACLVLLALTIWSFRNAVAATKWIPIGCLASFIALFLTGFAHGTQGFTVTAAAATRYYNPTLTLAGLILMSMVLSRFLRWSATKSACNCG